MLRCPRVTSRQSGHLPPLRHVITARPVASSASSLIPRFSPVLNSYQLQDNTWTGINSIPEHNRCVHLDHCTQLVKETWPSHALSLSCDRAPARKSWKCESALHKLSCAISSSCSFSSFKSCLHELGGRTMIHHHHHLRPRTHPIDLQTR